MRKYHPRGKFNDNVAKNKLLYQLLCALRLLLHSTSQEKGSSAGSRGWRLGRSGSYWT